MKNKIPKVKFRNVKGSFPYANTWIVKNVEAIITDDRGAELELVLNSREGSIVLPKEFFKLHFREYGEPSADDLIEFESKRYKHPKAAITKLVRAHIPETHRELFLIAVDKAHQDAYIAAGNGKNITIKEYEKYQLDKETPGGLKAFGDPVLNRSSRWTPIADEEDWLRSGDPAPVGIRQSDHARLSECNVIYLELLAQIFSMNHGLEIPEPIIEYLGIRPEEDSHKCFYCGNKVDIWSFKKQAYGAKEHPINFCHRDPSETEKRTRPGNIYFGHTRCNRIQGGLSELQRIRDGLRLLDLHRKDYFGDPEVQNLLLRLSPDL